MYVTIATLRNIIYAAAAKGADFQVLCKSVGLKPADLLQDFEKRIEGVEVISGLWEKVIELTKDECFGLHLGLKISPPALGLIGHLFLNCPTLRDVVDVLQKHSRSISGWLSWDYSVINDETVVNFFISPLWKNVSPHTARQAIEMSMGIISNIMIELSGHHIFPLRAELEFPKPRIAAEYDQALQCPVSFSKEFTRLFYKRDLLTVPVLNYDKSLYALFSKILHEREVLLSENISFIEKVRQVVINDFKGQVPPIDVIASHFNLSSRSFQRKLENENSNYRLLSNEIKKELTLALLKSPYHSTGEIARVLGYTESTAFHAAFKSWMKETPAKWRERNNIKSLE